MDISNHLPCPWRHSRPGWMGLWAVCSSCRCPCSMKGSWTRWPLKVPSNSNDPVILWFCELLHRKMELRMSKPGRVGWMFAFYSSFSLPNACLHGACTSKLHHWAEVTDAAAHSQLCVVCVDVYTLCWWDACLLWRLASRNCHLLDPLHIFVTSISQSDMPTWPFLSLFTVQGRCGMRPHCQGLLFAWRKQGRACVCTAGWRRGGGWFVQVRVKESLCSKSVWTS